MKPTYLQVIAQLDPELVDTLPVLVVIRCHRCGDRSKVLGRVHRHRDHGLVYQAWNPYWNGVGDGERLTIQTSRYDWTQDAETRHVDAETAVQDLLDWPAESAPADGRYVDEASGHDIIVGTLARCDRHGVDTIDRSELIRRARRRIGTRPAVFAIHHRPPTSV
jgi:hypothetical protein